MSKKPDPVAKLLQTGPRLALLEQAVRKREHLLHQIHEALPGDLAAHCTAADLHKGSLRLFCDAPAWAARIRLMTPELLRRLRRAYPGLANIQVRVALTSATGPARGRPVAHRPRPFDGDAAARSVEQTARNLSDRTLARALLRLARTLRRQ